MDALVSAVLRGEDDARDAARAVRQAAVDGRDLPVDALVGAALECNDITVLGPIADALVYFFVRTGDVGRLRETLANRHLRSYLLDGLRAMIERGEDIGKALDMLLDERIDLRRLLGSYLRKHRRAMRSVVERLAGWAGLPDLLSDLVTWEKAEIASVLPLLLPSIEMPGMVRVFRLAVDTGADLSQVEGALRGCLASRDPDVRENAAYALTRGFLVRGDWPSIDALGAVRGVLSAMIVHMHRVGEPGMLLISRVARALLTAEGEMASKALLGARLRGKPFICDDEVLRMLSGSRESAVREYLYFCALADRTCAEKLHRASPEDDIYGQILDGSHRPPCPVCLVLPRTGSWSSDGEVPPEATRVKAGACPICGRRYAFSRTEEYDDMSLEICISLTRLPPAVADVAGLRSPLAEVRADVACDVVECGLRDGDLSAISSCLGHADGTVRRAAVRRLCEMGNEGKTVAALRESLIPLLDDADPQVRRDAASLLVPWESARLMASSDAAVLVPTLRRIGDASRWRDRLWELSRHEDQTVRDLAFDALLSMPAERGRLLDLVLASLGDASADVRNLAADWAGSLAGEGVDVRPAVVLLSGLLEDRETAYRALHTLLRAARGKTDVSEALPALLRGLESGTVLRWIDALTLLEGMRTDLSPALPVVGRALSDGQSCYTALALLRKAFGAGCDLTPVEAELRAQLEDGNSYMREQATELLASWWMSIGRWTDVVTLLSHPRHGAVAGVAIAARERAERVAGRPDLVAALRAQADHVNGGVRSIVRDALKAVDAFLPSTSQFSAAPGRSTRHEEPPAPAPADFDRSRLVLRTAFDPTADWCFYPDVLFALATDGLRPLTHAEADALLAGGFEVDGMSPFITSSVIAYEHVSRRLGPEVVFAFDGSPTVRLATGPHEGEENVALFVECVRPSDLEVVGDEVRICVDASRLVPLRRFPDSIGWYLPHPATRIPCGFSDVASMDARKLMRIDGPFVGPVGRSGGSVDERRYVLAGNFAMRDRYAVLATPAG